MNLATLIFSTLILSSLTTHSAQAEDFDLSRIYRCDELFCPNGSSAPTAASENIRTRLGVVIVPASSTNFPVIERRVIQVSPQAVAAVIQQQSGGGSEPTVDTSSVDPSAPTNANAGSNENMFQQPGGQAAQSSQYSGQGAPAVGNSQLKAGGYLYSDDDEPGGSSDVDTSNKSGSALSNMAPSMDPVAQNKQNSNVGAGDEAGSFNPASAGGGGGGFGTFESGGAPTNKGLVAQVKDGLAEIAGSLGEKFFGSLGGKKSGKGRNSKGKTRKGSRSKLSMANAKEINARDILKRGLAQYGGRGLANKLEFGSSRSFLFQSMCQHYARYAKTHHIPNDRSRCPRK